MHPDKFFNRAHVSHLLMESSYSSQQLMVLSEVKNQWKLRMGVYILVSETRQINGTVRAYRLTLMAADMRAPGRIILKMGKAG